MLITYKKALTIQKSSLHINVSCVVETSSIMGNNGKEEGKLINHLRKCS